MASLFDSVIDRIQNLFRGFKLQHFPAVKLVYGEGTFAFYSFKRPEKLIVFVHGFSGNSLTTWKEFNSIIRSDSQFSTSDIIFYGYDSLHRQASESASYFCDFIKVHHAPQNAAINRHRETPENFQYKRIIFVAHSLGAIVVRRGLMTCYTNGEQWMNKVRMILFAPAHFGSKVFSGLFPALPGIGKALVGLVSVYYLKVLYDLKSDSKVVTELKADTHEYLRTIRNEEAGCLIAYRVVWAGGDNIVINEQFCRDINAIKVQGQGHTSVCKPNSVLKYREPLRVLLESLN
jgi:hypothetical protein